MLGFTLPLFIILAVEALVGVLLLCPKPLNQPAIKLTRLTYTQVGVPRPGRASHARGSASSCAPPVLHLPCWHAPTTPPRSGRLPPCLARRASTHAAAPGATPPTLQIGSTVFHTLAGVLALLLASPIYDGVRLYYSTKDKSEQANIDLRQAKWIVPWHERRRRGVPPGAGWPAGWGPGVPARLPQCG